MKNIILCGCGALGSHIAMGIAREGYVFHLFDDDAVERENILTSAYPPEAIGGFKARALGIMLYRKYGIETNPHHKTVKGSKHLTANHIFSEPTLLIDAFDNIEARSYTAGLDIPTVHISIGEQGIGAIEWNDVFQLPSKGYARGENPVCTNELGRNLILFTSTVASVIINKYLSTGVMESAYVNVDSLKIFR